jgi:hypothetical protein
MALDMRAGIPPDKEGRLERDTAVDAEMPLWQKPLLQKLRKGKRTINGIEGDEVAEKWTELNFVHTFGFNWEVNGTDDDVFVPYMHLEMSTGHPAQAGGRPVISFLGEEALVHLWDKIASSIRRRPAGAVPPAQPGLPPGPKLGDAASAGDICPETGWWECKDGANGANLAGGHRQLVKKGERMPQALLLRPQTLWGKLRRVQPSYESGQPPRWTLIDRRSRERLAPAAQLAAAVPGAGSSLMQANGAIGALAAAGRFAGTGATCPASGWWRCEDADALDGTRWFAQGELLPPATFRLPAARFRTATDAGVFQRRSRWQLVRQLPDHDNGPAAT